MKRLTRLVEQIKDAETWTVRELARDILAEPKRDAALLTAFVLWLMGLFLITTPDHTGLKVVLYLGFPVMAILIYSSLWYAWRLLLTIYVHDM